MIVVKVELWSARTGKVSTLGIMRISNDGTSRDEEIGNYMGHVMRKPTFTSITRTGIVEEHRRKSYPIWFLVAKMLRNMGYL